MSDVFEVAEILVEHAVETYGDVIAIIAYYGSYAKGRSTPTSDLDLFYIPDEGQAGALSSQFVLDGLPYDFWPISWSFAEGIADARSGRPWAVSASLIADARVLHHRSPADLARFEALQARIGALTRPECRGEMVARALEAFKEVHFAWGQLRLAVSGGSAAEISLEAHKFLYAVVNCLALLNQTYFSRGWGANWPEVFALPQQPPDFEARVEGLLTSREGERVLSDAEGLVRELRTLLLEVQASVAQPKQPGAVFADFYPFVFEYVQKVLSACERGKLRAARSAAFQLQEELSQAMNEVERGFYGAEFNLLGEVDRGYREAGFPDLFEPALRGDLDALARQVRRLDERVRAWLEAHGVALNVLESREALRRFLWDQ
ncbi:MAG: nucleotidyltransferase domain-containing protein [Anaerolineales bacterium]